MAACENSEGDALTTPSKRRRLLGGALQEFCFQIPAAEVAPDGYIVPALAGNLEVVAQERTRSIFAVYVLDACVHLILDFLRHELEG